MLGLIRKLFGWMLPKKQPVAPEPARKIKECDVRIIVIGGQPLCEKCGTKLPEFIVDPELIEIFFYGMVAAINDYGVGANPYWEGKHCYAIAAWNAGHDHVTECGNKKEPACST